jgi:hypothetical protein
MPETTIVSPSSSGRDVAGTWTDTTPNITVGQSSNTTGGAIFPTAAFKDVIITGLAFGFGPTLGLTQNWNVSARTERLWGLPGWETFSQDRLPWINNAQTPTESFWAGQFQTPPAGSDTMLLDTHVGGTAPRRQQLTIEAGSNYLPSVEAILNRQPPALAVVFTKNDAGFDETMRVTLNVTHQPMFTGLVGPWQAEGRADECPKCGLKSTRDTWVRDGYNMNMMVCPRCWDPEDTVGRQLVPGREREGIGEG